MSVQRLSLSDLIVQIRLVLGEVDADFSKISNAELVTLINAYGNRLPSRIGQILREHGFSIRQKTVQHPMWKTDGSLSTSAGDASATLPADFSTLIEFYDNTNERPIETVMFPSTWFYRHMKKRKPGPTTAIELSGFNTSGIRAVTLYPTPPAGVTPDIAVSYTRIPAEMPNSTPGSEYPDADPKYHMLWVYGPVLDLLGPDSPRFNEYSRIEENLVRDLVQDAA